MANLTLDTLMSFIKGVTSQKYELLYPCYLRAKFYRFRIHLLPLKQGTTISCFALFMKGTIFGLIQLYLKKNPKKFELCQIKNCARPAIHNKSEQLKFGHFELVDPSVDNTPCPIFL